MVSQKKLMTALLREDLVSFIAKCFHHLMPTKNFYCNWHIEVIAEYLRAVCDGQVSRLIISMPPRHLKSLCTNVAWPTWLMGKNPSNKIITVSYSRDLSAKHALDARQIMQSAWFDKLFPHFALSNEQNSKYKMNTTVNGFRLSTSVDSTITGEGADYIILDDPHNPAHIFSVKRRNKVIEWFERVIMSRLDDYNKGAIVVVMQRLHKDDLAGWLLASNRWTHLSLPIVAEQTMHFTTRIGALEKTITFEQGAILDNYRYNHDNIKQIKNEVDAYVFASQYMQNPIDIDNNPIKARYLVRYKQHPVGPVIMSWDTAASKNGCYSVGSVWVTHNGEHYLLDIIRGKWQYSELKSIVIDSYDRWKCVRVLIENKSSGQQLLQDLPSHIAVVTINPVESKESRLLKVVGLFEKGRVLLPETAPWLFDLEYELLSSPKNSDDQIDSITQYLLWIIANSCTTKTTEVRIRVL